MSSLGSSEKQLLLDVARRAVVAAVERRESLENLPETDGILFGGVFVTLHRRGRLRGCIGQIGAHGSLIQTVAHCAKCAALEDPRFSPVRVDELIEIEIELSVLSALEMISPGEIEAGKHGLLVSNGCQRGVLLPQVAPQFGWAAMRFLEETCLKAGLNREAWKDAETQVQAFTAEVFGEKDLGGEGTRDQEIPPITPAKTDYSSST